MKYIVIACGAVLISALVVRCSVDMEGDGEQLHTADVAMWIEPTPPAVSASHLANQRPTPFSEENLRFRCEQFHASAARLLQEESELTKLRTYLAKAERLAREGDFNLSTLNFLHDEHDALLKAVAASRQEKSQLAAQLRPEAEAKCRQHAVLLAAELQ